MTLAKSLLVWLLLAIVATANGIVRQLTYGQSLAELTAHQLSTVTAILAFAAVVWLFNRKWPFKSASQAVTIGAIWLLLTIAFEFGFGHFVVGHSWDRLLADYNIVQGRMWSLFVIWVAILPFTIFRLSAK